ncbi:MAG: phage major capsid protein [Bacteroidales bacterium]|jgi:HK97 family phage major capsid protein|nr:phage major capsid protein [Bacteroidales bacterium]
MAETTLRAVLDAVAEDVGLDPTKADNDPNLANAVSMLQERAVKRLFGDGADVSKCLDQVVSGETAEVAPAMGDMVRELKADLDKQRTATRNRPDGNTDIDPDADERVVRANMDDARSAMPEIVRHMDAVHKARGIDPQGSPAARGTLWDAVARETLDTLVVKPIDPADPTPQAAAIRALQTANDDVYTAQVMLGWNGRDPGAPNWKMLKAWRPFSEIVSYVETQRAMDTGTNASGGYWAPTQMSAALVEKVYEGSDVARLFPRVDFPQGMATWRLPVESTDVTVYLTGEATSDDSTPKFTASTPGTSYVDLSCKQLTARVMVSWEMIEDSVVPLIPHVRTKVLRQHSRAIDDAIINGDTAATHHDGDITNAADHRKAWIGLVEQALTNSTGNEDCGTYFNGESLSAPLIDMAQYANPKSTALLVNGCLRTKLCFLRDTLNNNMFLTFQQMGRPGGAETGTVDQFLGYPVITSEFVRKVVGASGYHTGSDSTYTIGIWVYLPAWKLSTKRNMTMAFVRYEDQGQNAVVGHWRGGFTHLYSTDITTAIAYGISAS